MCKTQIWSLIISNSLNRFDQYWLVYLLLKCKTQICSHRVIRLDDLLSHRSMHRTPQSLHPSSISIGAMSSLKTCSAPHSSIVIMRYGAGLICSKSCGSNPEAGRIFIIKINFWSKWISFMMRNSMNEKETEGEFQFSGVFA